jgi:centriolar protein POC1
MNTIPEEGDNRSFYGNNANFNGREEEQESMHPQSLKTFKGHRERITRIEFNPNLKQLVTTSNDAVVHVWNYKKNSRPYVFDAHKKAINALSINPSGNLIATGSSDKTIRIWNNSVEGFSKSLKSHSGPVRDLCFSCDGQLLVSCSDDKTVRMWNVNENKCLATIAAHKNWVRTCHMSPDSSVLVSGSDDTKIKLWDSTTCTEMAELTDHTGMINSVRFHPDGSCLASGATDKTIKVWDARSQRLLQHYDAHSKGVNSINFHPSGNYLVSTSQDASVKIWDLRQGSILYTLYAHEATTSAAAFSTYGNYFATGGQDTIVQIWKSNLGNQKGEYIDFFEDGAATSTKIIDSNTENAPKFNEEASEAKVIEGNIHDGPQVAVGEPPKSKLAEPEEDKRTLDYDEVPIDFRRALDKMVFQLDLVNKTVGALEHRLNFSEDKMAEVIDYFKHIDNEGTFRDIKSSAVIENSDVVKRMSPERIKRVIEFNDKQEAKVKVRPEEDVGEDFMRETNKFISISKHKF